MLNEKAVRHVLSGINDPELKKPLTDLGMVDRVDINNGFVTIGIRLTVPGCPQRNRIAEDIATGVGLIEGVTDVTVEFEVMSDQQRESLKEKLGYGKEARPRGIPVVKPFAKRFIVVASGKGGVGKSTVTANLAAALAARGRKVGLLDADVYGFSIPRMLDIHGEPTQLDNKLVPPRWRDSLQVMSMGFFVGEDDPVVWRGPMLHKAINQFLTDVIWDELDICFLDLPPGTGDVTMTISQAIPTAELIVVTTPQATATHTAGRVAKLAERSRLKVIGVIENMAYYETPKGRDYVFGRDGGQHLAERLAVPLLGQIPLDTSIREGSDNGHPVAVDGSENLQSLFAGIVDRLENPVA